MKNVRFISFLLTIALLFGVIGCKETATSPVEESIESSQDNALADGEFTSVFSFFDAQSETTFQSNMKGSPTIQGFEKKSEAKIVCVRMGYHGEARLRHNFPESIKRLIQV